MQLASLLKTTFGFEGFRVNQEAVCRAATDGRDVLLVMPTGAGKSLCYQLPALARGGTALVVSPLIALMDDQALKLSAAGLKVARIHSGLSREESRQACRDYLAGKLQFLFIAPERMRVPGFPEMLARKKPSLIAVDEAHCISAWGHDFRPDYRMLGQFLPALRPAPIIALTATATPTVQKDIVTQLGLQQPSLFIHGFRRDNLSIEVLELSKPQRLEFTAKFLDQQQRRPAIVYAPSRKAAEELADALGRRFPAEAYHAGLDAAVRERVQAQFQSGKLECVVATIAFGMGIDKADVRTVVHYALPASVEAYYQEIGRAGRDGEPSRTVLLYSFADRKMHDFFLEQDYPVATELTRVARALTDETQMPDVLRQRLKMDAGTFDRAVEKLAGQGAAQVDIAGNVRGLSRQGAPVAWQSGYEAQVEFRRSQIERMMAFATTQQCRMTALIRHFGDTADAHRPCGHCDFCNPAGVVAQSLIEPSAQQEKHLRTILRSLAGGLSKSTGKLFTELGLAKERSEFDGLLDGLARAGLIAIESTTFINPEGRVVPFKKASLTHEGREIESGTPLGVVLRGASAEANAGKETRRAKRPAKEPVTEAELTPSQQALETELRAWRKAEAAKTGKPAFLVCSDTTLRAAVVARPQTLSELLTVSGFGQEKADRYGAAICAMCRAAAGVSDKAVPTRETVSEPARPVSLPAPTGPPLHLRIAAAPRTIAPAEKSNWPTSIEINQPASLNNAQRELEDRLRAWRKGESEKMGLPQFFVLGTTTLRSIVLERPRTLKQLLSIQGVGPEKLEKFGPSILEVLNG